MLDLRVELHRRAGRARDVMQAEDAHEVVAAAAGDLGVTDRFDLARALSGAARTVVFATDTALRSARSALPRRGLAALRRPPARRPLDDGVVEHAGEVVLARDAQVSRDPALVLRLAATAARTQLPIAAGTLHRLADAAPELREPWPRAALSELLALLGAGEGTVDVIEALTAPACGAGCSPSGARCATCPRGTARTSGPSTATSSRSPAAPRS